MRGEPKVTSSHLERLAICYIRQSSLVQVREHTESTARQYTLAALATRLGWPAAGIEVIDCDLSRKMHLSWARGSSPAERQRSRAGFWRVRRPGCWLVRLAGVRGCGRR